MEKLKYKNRLSFFTFHILYVRLKVYLYLYTQYNYESTFTKIEIINKFENTNRMLKFIAMSTPNRRRKQRQAEDLLKPNVCIPIVGFLYLHQCLCVCWPTAVCVTGIARRTIIVCSRLAATNRLTSVPQNEFTSYYYILREWPVCDSLLIIKEKRVVFKCFYFGVQHANVQVCLVY